MHTAVHACGSCPVLLRLSARAPPALAEDETDQNEGDDCTTGAPFPLEGVDLVAYFSLAEGDEPLLGSPKYVSTYGDYNFQFSSARNLALFEVCLNTGPRWMGHENRERRGLYQVAVELL